MDWNMKDAFPDVDLDNLPPEFAEFIRVSEPDIDVGEFEVPYLSHYDWVGNKVKDIWVTRAMTQEERNAIDAAAHNNQISSINSNGSVPDVD